jgi:hypothetical protein
MEDETHGEGFGCECDACSLGLDVVKEREKAMIKEYGWAADYVRDEPNTPFHINYHTHGLTQYGHPDLQVCLPLDPRIIHSIVTAIIEKIKAGEKFEEKKEYTGFLSNDLPITFLKVTECDRPVLRIIFPDPDGNIWEDAMEDKYKLQWQK